VKAVTIDRADGVDHELCRQLKAWCNSRLTSRAANAWSNLGHFKTRFVKFVASRAMDCTVNTTTAEHYLIRRVDNGINRERRDIAFDNLDSHAYILP
jgi:hypothetical protein